MVLISAVLLSIPFSSALSASAGGTGLAAVWENHDYTDGDERLYRLVLREDGGAQLIELSSGDFVAGVSEGRWHSDAAERITISLKRISGTGKKSFGGEYGAYMGDFSTLTLDKSGSADPLIPVQRYEAVTFYRADGEAASSSEDDYKELLSAVRAYYEEESGTVYPGDVEVESVSDEGVYVRLSEDMKTHRATSAIYCVDPETFKGTDEIMGTEIDFSPWRKPGRCAGASGTNEEVLESLGLSPEKAWQCLRRAAARRFDESCQAYEDRDAFPVDSILDLRFMTVSRSNLSPFILPLTRDGERLYAEIPIGTAAGSGVFTERLEVPLSEEGVVKKAALDGVRAELKNNRVTLRFARSNGASFSAAKAGVPVEVEGLYGKYTDIFLGYAGNGGDLFLCLTDTEGRLSFCNLFRCAMTHTPFYAIGPVLHGGRIAGYRMDTDAGGSEISVLMQDGEELSISEFVSFAEGVVSPIFANTGWGCPRFSLGLYDGRLRIEDASGVLASDGSVMYLGMTGEGMHYLFDCFDTDGSYLSGILTLEYRPEEQGGSVLIIKQLTGPRLEVLPGSGEMMLFPACG